MVISVLLNFLCYTYILSPPLPVTLVAGGSFPQATVLGLSEGSTSNMSTCLLHSCPPNFSGPQNQIHSLSKYLCLPLCGMKRLQQQNEHWFIDWFIHSFEQQLFIECLQHNRAFLGHGDAMVNKADNSVSPHVAGSSEVDR